MKFGMHYFWHHGPPSRLIEDAERTEASNFHFMGLTDSQLLFRDIYSSLAVVAHAAPKLELGPMVTNPVTRDPSVTAGGICSLAELAEARVVLGIGTGHSAVNSIGKTPARLADMRDAITTIKSLCRGESVEGDGTEYDLEWVRGEYGSFDVPVFMAAEGEKTQQLAGRIADGVIFNGPDTDLVQRSADRIAEGAEAVGRDPDEIEKWVKVRANVANDHRTAVDEIKTALADYASVMYKSPHNREAVPREYADRIERFVDEYESHGGYHSNDGDDVALIDELELTEFLAERFAIAGTPEECIEQCRTLRETGEVDGVLMSTDPDQQRRFIERMSSDVLARLSPA